MNIRIICLGSLKEDYLRIAQEELLGNISRKNRVKSCTLVELMEEPLKEDASEAMILKALEEEGQRILEKLPRSGRTICLDIQGKKAKPSSLREVVDDMDCRGLTDLTFIIGGSHGISEQVKRKAELLSFSSLTYPHQLFRIALLEAVDLYL